VEDDGIVVAWDGFCGCECDDGDDDDDDGDAVADGFLSISCS